MLRFGHSYGMARMLQRCGQPLALGFASRASCTTDAALSGFGQLGVSPTLVSALKESNISDPTPIQALAIPRLLKTRSGSSATLLSAQTGTGKTMAYLVPLVQRLKASEEAQKALDAKEATEGEGDAKSTAKTDSKSVRRPRAVILVPSRELAIQVLANTKSLTKAIKLSAGLLIGGKKQGPQTRLLTERSVDILVATPGRLRLHRDQENLFYTKLEQVVIDEADTMLSKSGGFLDHMEDIIDPVKGLRAHHDKDVRIVMASATVTDALKEKMNTILPGYDVIGTDEANRALKTFCQHEFRRILKHKGQDKQRELLATINNSSSKQILVFCNSAGSARSTEHFLRESGVSTASLHGDIPPKLRQENWVKFSKGQSKVLVCTDISARGLDTLSVQHVVMFDFALDGVTYLHRAGRTARAGTKGKVTCLINKREEACIQNGDRLEKWTRSNAIKEAELVTERLAKAKAAAKKAGGVKGKNKRPLKSYLL